MGFYRTYEGLKRGDVGCNKLDEKCFYRTYEGLKLRQMIKEGLESGIRFGTANREICLCLLVAMNELGVKKP
ncbi:hypothetical protein E5Z46_04820 [Geobacillus kaustophilus NBRC 102445]|nr:hypothetical protein E5Z46_04820 [Geobacillus kaustophilus NBRC 102445]